MYDTHNPFIQFSRENRKFQSNSRYSHICDNIKTLISPQFHFTQRCNLYLHPDHCYLIVTERKHYHLRIFHISTHDNPQQDVRILINDFQIYPSIRIIFFPVEGTERSMNLELTNSLITAYRHSNINNTSQIYLSIEIIFFPVEGTGRFTNLELTNNLAAYRHSNINNTSQIYSQLEYNFFPYGGN